MSRSIGMIVLAAGTGYLVLIAWLLSWWIVPGYREHGPGSCPYPYGTEVLACSQFGRSPGLLEPSSPLLAQLSLRAYRDGDWRCRQWEASSLSHGSPSSQSHRTIPFSSALAGV